ncbi:unnamed protein product [Rangifer tarandus platyrhynchus]|uniref:Uncharacterized protein n=1 Tax=Rangifer tarandus platyrhynchus TaxID=3082113 RepID=A0ABN8Z3X9_RANTA|nr:unnamed protein product [Rangifer tarandus platyrhynchus]
MGGWPMSHMDMETWQRRVGTSRLVQWQEAGSSRIRCLGARAAMCEKVERDEPGKHPHSSRRRVDESGRDDGDHRGGQCWDPEVGDPEAVVTRGGGAMFPLSLDPVEDAAAGACLVSARASVFSLTVPAGPDRRLRPQRAQPFPARE